MRDTIDAGLGAKANIAPWHFDWPTLPRPPALPLPSALFIKGQLLRLLRHGKNRFVNNFDPASRMPRDRSSRCSIAAPFVAAPAGAQSVGQAGPSSGIVAEQQQIIDGLKQEDRRASRPRSTASREDDTALVEIRLQLEELARAAAQERPRLPAAARRDQRQDRAARPAAGEGQPAEPDIVTQRTTGADRREGRDQRRARRCRKPVAARQRADRPDRRTAPRAVHPAC